MSLIQTSIETLVRDRVESALYGLSRRKSRQADVMRLVSKAVSAALRESDIPIPPDGRGWPITIATERKAISVTVTFGGPLGDMPPLKIRLSFD